MDPKDWNLEQLKEWLSQSLTQEDNNFDLKEKIPNDENGKCRLKKEFCGFANGNGGFLFFGIDDNKNIHGLDKNNNEFNTILSQIVTSNVFPPTICWKICNIIDIERDKKCVYFVKINESVYWNKPHVFYKDEKGLFIPMRENGHLRHIKDGSEIRRIFLNENGYYPEYNIHISNILLKIKNSSSPELTLLEAKLINGYKSYLRKQSNGAEASIFLDKIETTIANIKKVSLTNITEGGPIVEGDNQSELENNIDEFLEKYLNI